MSADSEKTEKKVLPPAIKRSIVDILADLRKPIAAKHIHQKKQGTALIDFCSWFHRIQYLDHYAAGWSYEVRSIENIAGKVVLTVRISIPCLEGIVYREATGQEDENTNSYGDSTSNAEAMALSRASAKFGLGLALYSK